MNVEKLLVVEMPAPSTIRRDLDGEPFVFEWEIFPGHTTTQLLEKSQNLMEDELQIQPQNVEDRILFMSMYSDIDWTAKDNRSLCEKHSSRVSEYARQSPMGRWTFLGPGDKDEWCGALSHKPHGEWNRTGERSMPKFGESRHPVLRGTSPLSRGSLKSNGGGKVSIQFNAKA